MQSADGTVVFVEVRQRSRSDFGGAAASIGPTKQRRIVLAARHYLMRWRRMPPSRFDVVLLDGAGPVWLQAAFDAS
jgi:putative endonuclease